jgi:hypothetical protein
MSGCPSDILDESPDAKGGTMKRRILRAGFLPVLAAAAWACAANPGPGETGYPYNLTGGYRGEFLVEGMAFTFTMELRTGAEGALAGDYRVTDPVAMSGPLAGTVSADSVRFSLNYLNPMDGCGGVVDGAGIVETGGGSFSGRARVNDSCNGFLSATFAMRR